MLVTWRYRPRGSLLETFDPRARWFFSFLILFSIIQFWDVRFLAFFFVIVMGQYALGRLTWGETRRAWIFLLIFIVGIVALNSIFTGRGGPEDVLRGGHVLWRMEWEVLGLNVHPTITVERVWFAFSQILRMFSISVLFLIVPYTMDPCLYGVTFRGMGIPDRFAFSMDLAFRFVPTLARDFNATLDAQRARGYEVDRLRGGLFAQIRKMAPVVVPVTMNAILSGEDITNAMDLRCFGLRKRTWVQRLTYRRRDYLLMGFGILIFALALVCNVVLDLGDFWVPAWALTWAG
ncbi:MAG: energy-coupling factor transporter transmembrane component T family protein [Anaerolineae bacterium]